MHLHAGEGLTDFKAPDLEGGQGDTLGGLDVNSVGVEKPNRHCITDQEAKALESVP